MWYHKDNKSSKNKCNSGSIYSGCLAKGVREGRGFIPVAVTPLKSLRLPAGSWRGYIKHLVWVLWTNTLKTPPATSRFLAWIHQTLGIGPVNQQIVKELEESVLFLKIQAIVGSFITSILQLAPDLVIPVTHNGIRIRSKVKKLLASFPCRRNRAP